MGSRHEIDTARALVVGVEEDFAEKAPLVVFIAAFRYQIGSIVAEQDVNGLRGFDAVDGLHFENAVIALEMVRGELHILLEHRRYLAALAFSRLVNVNARVIHHIRSLIPKLPSDSFTLRAAAQAATVASGKCPLARLKSGATVSPQQKS